MSSARSKALPPAALPWGRRPAAEQPEAAPPIITWPAGVAGPVRRLWRRTGTRLALVQAVAVVLAFVLAGYFTQISIQHINQDAIRGEIKGEVDSLDDEVALKGLGGLPHTIDKRSRLWRGFEYRLMNAAGRSLAGRLDGPQRLPLGWSRLDLLVGGNGPRPFMVYSKLLADGSLLTVGHDLTIENQQMAAVAGYLWLCGGLGVLVCLGASYAFSRSTWRRVALVAATAHQVSQDRLDVRVPLRPTTTPDDIDELGSGFNAMLERIGGLVDRLRQVSSDIAHDLRTPLTRVRQKLERLETATAGQPAISGAVHAIDADIGEILRIFDALLQLAEIEARSLSKAPATADLADVASRVAEAFRPDIEESGRRLVVDVTPTWVAGDPGLLTQVAANLLENALHHTPVGAEIRVEVGQGPDGPCLAVADDGPGIPSDRRQAVLAPFVRLEASRNAPGSGLGLSIVAAIATRHGARLELKDAHPGLRVELTLPA